MKPRVLAAFALLALAAAPPDRTKIDWVRIPGGTFLMGSDEHPREGPVRRVKVKAFELGRTEVTNRQYQACAAAGACTGLDMDCLGPAFRGPE
ncbi:MAG: formylglycine-generating enzyme family protein, partial [Elusimicrobia bacterium]|nr:formylglycine-generating enzyme family protein [Elusimicrobiota bacterium]